MYRETHLRSVAKAISYRVLGSVATGALVLAFTGQLGVAAAVGGLEALAKLALYFVHERVWDRLRYGRHIARPTVIWFTGLSGAGKSTVAKAVAEALSKRGYKVEQLDGDIIRSLFPTTGFTRPERDAHIRRVGYLASRLEQNGVFVVASLVSPYEESRRFVRSLCKNFVEVYVSTPLAECERRDVKGLYAKARAGTIQNFTGVSDPYEPPTAPEVTLDTSGESLEQSVQLVMKRLEPNL